MNVISNHMGSQWALFMPTVGFTGVYMGHPRTRLSLSPSHIRCILKQTFCLELMRQGCGQEDN